MNGRGTVDFFLTKNRDLQNRASMMADQKASVILGAEFIILTLIVSGIWNPKSETTTFAPPLWSVVLVISILVSVAYALLVLVPFLSFDRLTKKQPQKSLLFFSSVADMDQEDYIKEMRELIKDDNKIYNAILTDLYNEALLLKNKKFRYLDISYLMLIIGIPLSILVFIMERQGVLDATRILGPIFNL